MPDIDFYYKRSRLNQLKGFCSVVQNGCCIARAAEKTNVEADTISKQVRTLERDLKIPLMDRSKHHTLSLTPEGKLFYDKAIIHLNGMDSLFENFHKDVREFNNKNLNIALYDTAATYVFPKILGKMVKLEEFKDLNVTIYSIKKDEAIKKLVNKEIDMAFYIIDSRDIIPVELDIFKSLKNSVSLIFNKNHPLAKKETITRKDMESYNFLKKDMQSKSNNTIDSYFNAKFGNIKTIGASFEVVTEIIRYTNNIAIVPNILIDKHKSLLESDIIHKNIDYLLSDAFFHAMTLKNYSMKKPVLFILEELKKLALESNIS